jgi:hypothetical protein
VDVSPLANCHDEDQEYVVVDLVDDAVATGADPPFAVSAHVRSVAGRAAMLKPFHLRLRGCFD